MSLVIQFKSKAIYIELKGAFETTNVSFLSDCSIRILNYPVNFDIINKKIFSKSYESKMYTKAKSDNTQSDSVIPISLNQS